MTTGPELVKEPPKIEKLQLSKTQESQFLELQAAVTTAQDKLGTYIKAILAGKDVISATVHGLNIEDGGTFLVYEIPNGPKNS